MNAKLFAEIAAGLATIREVMATVEAAFGLAKQVSDGPHNVSDDDLATLAANRKAALERFRASIG